jgi:hypothetical protein
MTGRGVPPPPVDNSADDTLPNPYSLAQALEHAYYNRDVETLRRLAHQAEMQIQRLSSAIPAPPATPAA